MAVPSIRYKNRSGKANPVEGSMVVLPVQFDDIGNSEVAAYKYSPPTGTKMEIIAIDARATAVSGDPSLQIGSSIAGTQIVDPVTLTSALGELTLVATEITASSVLDVRLTADSADTAESVSVTVFGYISNIPDSLAVRSAGHF